MGLYGTEGKKETIWLRPHMKSKVRSKKCRFFSFVIVAHWGQLVRTLLATIQQTGETIRFEYLTCHFNIPKKCVASLSGEKKDQCLNLWRIHLLSRIYCGFYCFYFYCQFHASFLLKLLCVPELLFIHLLPFIADDVSTSMYFRVKRKQRKNTSWG